MLYKLTHRNIYLQRWAQLALDKFHNIPESKLMLFTVGYCQSFLWPEATRFNKSQIPDAVGTDYHKIQAKTNNANGIQAIIKILENDSEKSEELSRK